MNLHKILFSLIFFAISTALIGQAGYSSGSMSMGKMRSKAVQCPTPQEVVVEEYMNYHRHDLPLPQKGEPVKLSMKWGNENFNQFSTHSVLQVGLTTSRIQNAEAPPINVSLVIDKSGSMNGDRIHHARQAAKTFVDKLREEDIVSIITFDHNVRTILPAQSAANKAIIKQAIDGIYPGGSTNLNDGLLKGYDEVIKNYHKKITNKVIMLTDALTNTGQIDPEAIVRNSMNYTDDTEIDITVIGVGVNFNNDLARQITSSNRSSIHFIYDAADIQKVFVDEVESLLSPVAKDAKLTIEFDKGLMVEQFFGYQPSLGTNKIEVDLNKMNNGLTQVFLLKFKLDPKNIQTKNVVKTTLTYFDIKTNKNKTVKEEAVLEYIKNGLLQLPLLDNPVVSKNYTIAELAQGIKNMAIAMQQKNDPQAARHITRMALDNARQRYNGRFDVDVQRVYDILSRYDQAMLAMQRRD